MFEGKPKRVNKNEEIRVRINEDTKISLDALARVLGTSMSGLVRDVIGTLLRDPKNQGMINTRLDLDRELSQVDEALKSDA